MRTRAGGQGTGSSARWAKLDGSRVRGAGGAMCGAGTSTRVAGAVRWAWSATNAAEVDCTRFGGANGCAAVDWRTLMKSRNGWEREDSPGRGPGHRCRGSAAARRGMGCALLRCTQGRRRCRGERRWGAVSERAGTVTRLCLFGCKASSTERAYGCIAPSGSRVVTSETSTTQCVQEGRNSNPT